jgi:hypothetical protein
VREYPVQGDMVAVQRVRAERHVLDADQAGTVAEVVHDRLDRVPRVRGGQCRVRGGRHPDDAPGRGDRAQHVVGFHARDVPDRPGPGVGDEHRPLAALAGVQGGAVARVGQVDGQAQLVHPRHRPAAERGQPAVAGFGQAAAERVGVGVGDADLPQAQAVQHVEPVEFVLDRRGGLQPEHQPGPPGPVGLVDVGDGADGRDVVLVGQVRQTHAEVGDDVVPPPRGVPGDARRAVHHVVEHDGQARRRQARVGGVLAPGAVVLGGLLHPQREPDRMVVQADHQAVAQQPPGPLPLPAGQARQAGPGWHPAELRGQLEAAEVLAGGQVGVRRVAVSHDR